MRFGRFAWQSGIPHRKVHLPQIISQCGYRIAAIMRSRHAGSRYGFDSVMTYTVYILQSDSTKRRYIGFTEDIGARLKQHNSGNNLATKGRGPWKLVYSEEFDRKTDAIKREQVLKRMKGGIQLKKLIEN